MKPTSVASAFQLKVPGTGSPSGSRRVKAASVLAGSMGMEKVTEIGLSMRTLAGFSGFQRRIVGSVVRNEKVWGSASTPPVVSSSPAATVTLYVVDAASPLFAVNRYRLVFTHVPRPASVGVMTSGWGSAS